VGALVGAVLGVVGAVFGILKYPLGRGVAMSGQCGTETGRRGGCPGPTVRYGAAAALAAGSAARAA
jgi:hypothetical protein